MASEALCAGCPNKIWPRLRGYCEGAADSVITILTHLGSSSFNLEFGTLFESI